MFKMWEMKFRNLDGMQQRLVQKGINIMSEAEMAVLQYQPVDLDLPENQPLLLPPPALLPMDAERVLRLL
jgi:hypothetical protein